MIKGNNADRKAPLEITDIYKLRDEQQMGKLANEFDLFFENEILSARSTNQTTTATVNILAEFWKSPLTKAILKM